MERVILHADMNNFYASVECMKNPELKQYPIAVCGDVEERHGIVLAKKLKEIYPKINIVFVTGYSQYANEAFALHASGYVYKPVTADKIINEMENLRNPIKWKNSGNKKP